MIELPRAALKADEIAAGEDGAEFFSFGTNDLTQTTPGPVARRCGADPRQLHASKQVFEVDPFVSIDMRRRRRARPHRHRARPQARKPEPQGRHLRRARRRSGSIAFFDEAGLDYVSCSPFRVPVARLAAAQAAIRRKRGGGPASTD